MNNFKILLYVLILILILSCRQPSGPSNEQPEWQNITHNLSGESIFNIITHDNDIYVSTENTIYILNDNFWDIIMSLDNNISDFKFNNDTLVVLSKGKVYFFNELDSLIEKYDANMDILPSHKLIISNDEIFIGSTGQLGATSGWEHLRYGLAKMNKEKNVYYPMENYNTSYSVNRMLSYNGTIYVGTLTTTGYFVGMLENDTLIPIGLTLQGLGCYSMLFFNGHLMVGTDGKILIYQNSNFQIYKEPLPMIQNTALEDKAVSLSSINNQLIVGTIYNGILKYNDDNSVWENYTSKNLPSGYSINGLKSLNDNLYGLLGIFNSFDSPESQYIYKLNISMN